MKKNRFPKTCLICGTDFTVPKHRADKAKYCSEQCRYKAMYKVVKHNCVHCGKEFEDSPSVKRKYCSRACVQKVALKDWKPKFSTVRKAMLRRGLLTRCSRCGYDVEPRILGVHHIDRDRDNNDLSNLEVLCPNCHSLEHMCHTPHGFKE